MSSRPIAVRRRHRVTAPSRACINASARAQSPAAGVLSDLRQRHKESVLRAQQQAQAQAHAQQQQAQQTQQQYYALEAAEAEPEAEARPAAAARARHMPRFAMRFVRPLPSSSVPKRGQNGRARARPGGG
jgi:hypothetical protein